MNASEYMLNIMKKDLPILITTGSGSTDYIDFINYEDVSNPVTKGYDIFGRPFIVIRAIMTRNNGNTFNVFETFFQRYTGGGYWMGCGHGGTKFLDTDGGLSEDQAIFLTELIENNFVELTLNNRKCFLLNTCKINLI
jgi:hypothetical protein